MKTKKKIYNEVYVARNKKEYERVVNLLQGLKVDYERMPNSFNIAYNRKD